MTPAQTALIFPVVEILDLRDAPDMLSAAVSLVWHEWRHLTDETLADAEAAWRSHLDAPRLPAHLVASADGTCIGTATLAPFDLPIRPNLTPWLAAVIVEPAWRGRGVGGDLVASAERLARDRYEIESIYLFTTDSADFYRQRGWRRRERDTYRNEHITIMGKSLRS